MPVFRHVLVLLPPDPWAPPEQRSRRLPPQGAALVAAVCGDLGLTVRAVDLEHDAGQRPIDDPTNLLTDDARLWDAARRAGDPAAEALAERLLERLGDLRADGLLVSIERHTQLPLAAFLGTAIKRRAGLPVALGGQNGGTFAALLAHQGVTGVDVATGARTPSELRRVVQGLLELPGGRLEPAVDPLDAEEAPPSDGWPLPDFGIYDLAAYRQPVLPGQSGAGTLVLPYTPSFGCAFRCAFCQDPQVEAAQPALKVVADLREIGQRWGARDFVFLSCQLNQAGAALARALREAGLDVRWSDSWRVTPSPPGVFDELAAGGCAGLTFGVESGSRRVLQRMRKGHRPEDATRVVREAAAAGLFTRVNLLPCFPGETAAELAETVAWTRANAPFIDDLAPSSFYLDALSPIGRQPERFGLRLRGVRELAGEDRFRKSPRAATYDEVGGLSWEERQRTLRPAEDALRVAWQQGRGDHALAGGLDAISMLLLRRRHATREAAYVERIALGRAAAPASTAQALPAGLGGLALRVAELFPSALRAGLRLARDEGALLVCFVDAEGREHVLEATAAFAVGAGVGSLAWAYREPAGPGTAARFLGSYRRLFAAFASLEVEVAQVLRSPVVVAATTGVGAAGLATPHVDEGDLVAAALGDLGSAGVAGLVAQRAVPGLPACYFLVLENPCEQACEFCGLPQERALATPHAERFPPGRDLIDSGAFDALLTALAARGGVTELCLTGHDWSSHPRLDALLQRLERGPNLPLSLYGPSTRLAEPELARRVLALPGLREVRLTLHSPDPRRHDAITGTPGSGARVLEAIRRVRERGVALRVNAVLTRRAVEGLPELLDWAASRGLRVTLLAFLPDRTPVPFDGRDLLLPWSVVRAHLEQHGTLAFGVVEELLGLPTCAAPPALRSRLRATWNSPRGLGVVFPEACSACAARPGCAGVSRLYADTWGGEGLEPRE